MPNASNPIRTTRQACVLCGRFPASTKGEHVYPRWLIHRLFPDDDGPYTTVIDGRPLMKRDGTTPHSDNHFPPLLLPVCDESQGGHCNPTLSRRFEQAAMKEPVIAMLNGGILDEDEANRASLWWLKTALLASHPLASRRHPDASARVWNGPVDPSLYKWMISGINPPEGLSLWMAVVHSTVRDMQHRGESESLKRIDLPTFSIGSKTFTSQVSDTGIANLQFQLLAHPGWEPQHPFDQSGLALRLHPWRGGSLDMTARPCLSGSEFGRWLHLWGAPMRLQLVPEYDPRKTPWVLGEGWASAPNVSELSGVSGAWR